jgi:drug/metabolite transporter (DMT)-like permease
MNMSSTAFGTLAALVAPLVMVFGLYVWEHHWKGGSPFALNLFKCCTASCGFIVASYAARSGVFFPEDVFTTEVVGYLFLSSAIGILVGDWAWLEAQQKIGTLRVVLVDTTKPFLAALLGWFILKEELRWEAFLGMALTVVGVLVVTSEQNPTTEREDDQEPIIRTGENKDHTGHTEGVIASDDVVDIEDILGEGEEVRLEEANMETSTDASAPALSPPTVSPTNSTLRYGYIMAVLNVSLDSYGSLLTKQYGVGMTTWEISLLRFGFAGAVMLFVSIMLHIKARCIPTPTLVHNANPWYSLPSLSRTTWLYILAGVALVTFLTPALSNFALFQIPLALAITLGSIGPLYALPVDFAFKGNVPTVRSVMGCALAVGGIVLLAIRGTATKD